MNTVEIRIKSLRAIAKQSHRSEGLPRSLSFARNDSCTVSSYSCVFVANLLYGISKFPLIYVSSPQGERMEVRGLSSLSFLKDKKPLIIGIIEIPMLQEIIGV